MILPMSVLGSYSVWESVSHPQVQDSYFIPSTRACIDTLLALTLTTAARMHMNRHGVSCAYASISLCPWSPLAAHHNQYKTQNTTIIENMNERDRDVRSCLPHHSKSLASKASLTPASRKAQLASVGQPTSTTELQTLLRIPKTTALFEFENLQRYGARPHMPKRTQ